MKLIESKAEYIPQAVVPEGFPEGTSPTQESLLQGIYQQIELAGRTAYHSLDKITPTSAKVFVDRMITSHHGAALEHGTVYLKVEDAYEDNKPKDIFPSGQAVSTKMYPWLNTPYCRINKVPSKEYPNSYDAYITTNLRYIWEKELGDLQGIHNEFLMHMCSPTEFHEKRYTMRFTCSRAIANELVRHRVFSFLQESTRYINYSKERHGGGITFIKPSWLNIPTGIVYWHDGICWRVQQDENNPMEWFSVIPKDGFSEEEAQITSTYFDALSYAEQRYFFLLKEKCQPQQARDVLPNATKTELIMTGFASDYRHLLDLRLFEKTGAVHPDMKDLMLKAQVAMQEAGIWDDIMKYPSKFD